MLLPPKDYAPLKPLALMGIIWIIPSILFYLLSYTDTGKIFSSQLLSFIVIVFFVLLLSTIMAVFFKFEKNTLYDNGNLRRNLLVILTIVRLLVFQIENEGSFIGVLAGIVGTTTLILISCLVGSYLSQAINRLSELIPVCSVAFTVDLYSVLNGPSKEIALQIKDFYINGAIGQVPYADIILLKIANPSAEYLTPIFGVSDWIFVVFITSVMLKFEIPDSILGKDIKDIVSSTSKQFYFPIVSFALLVSIFTAYILNIFIPALPVIIVIILPWLIVKNRNLLKLKATDCYLSLAPPLIAGMTLFLST